MLLALTRSPRFVGSTVGTMLGTFLMVFYSPFAMAAGERGPESSPLVQRTLWLAGLDGNDPLPQFSPVAAPQRYAGPPRQRELEDSDRLSRALREMKEVLAATRDGATAAQVERLRTLGAQVRALAPAATRELAAAERYVEGAGERLRVRHDRMRERLATRTARLVGLLDSLEQATTDEAEQSALTSLRRFMRREQFQRRHQRFDPARLPVRSPGATERAPRRSRERSEPQGRSGEPVMLAASEITPGMVQVAMAPPAIEDTQANEDVQITAEIVALAASLEDNPVAIYNWVRSNVVFQPTYGSVKGSRLTLETRSGNAFDTASLLIALLRAAGVPARYVLGTVRLDPDAARNWVGGAETLEVAQQILGQGGVPNVAIVDQSGVAQALEIEHAWVEAHVDFTPGRGNLPLAGDRWVPLDASFKQYRFESGVTLLENFPFDAAALNAALLAEADVDDALGSVRNVPNATIDRALEVYGEQATAFAIANGLPPSLDSVRGRREVLPSSVEVFGPALPYQVESSDQPVATLPESMRHYVTVTVYTAGLLGIPGARDFSHRISLPALNTNRLGLTYPPATTSDAAVLQNARDTGASSLPVYLVDVVPTLTLDGVTLTAGSPTGMGSDQSFDIRTSGPGAGNVERYQIVAGDESVIGVNGNGLTAAAVEGRLARVPADTAAETLNQAALHYWMEADLIDDLFASGKNVLTQRLPSFGVFASPLSVSYLFGFPRTGVYQGRTMDVKLVLSATAGADPDDVVAFRRASGLQGSFLEGDVFDQLFGHHGVSAGISAVRLLSDANEAGQPLYYIDSSNVAAVMPLLLVSSEVKADISASVAQGKSVLVSRDEVDRGDWQGVGYIVRDETTGTGAYLISGGLNGGGLFDCLPDLVPVLLIILAIVAILLLAWWLGPIIAAALGGLAKPAFAMLAMLAMLLGGTSTAYAAGSMKSKQANPCCPPPPPATCVYHTTHPHWPCDGVTYPMDHWHANVWNQNAQCVNFGPRHVSLNTPAMCGPPPVPCPPC